MVVRRVNDYDAVGSAALLRGAAERRRQPSDVYFNSLFDAEPHTVDVGAAMASASDGVMLVSMVGSGLLIALHDKEAQVGALCSMVLPEAMLRSFPYLEPLEPALVERAFEPIARAANMAVALGAEPGRVRARIFGGMVLEGDRDDAGLKTLVLVKEQLFRRKFAVAHVDIGGDCVRRVHFFPRSGKVVRRYLKRRSDREIMMALEGAFEQKMALGALHIAY